MSNFLKKSRTFITFVEQYMLNAHTVYAKKFGIIKDISKLKYVIFFFHTQIIKKSFKFC